MRLAIGISPALIVIIGLGIQLDLGMNVHISQAVGYFHFFHAAEGLTLTATAVSHHRQVVNAQHHILGRANNRMTISRLEQIARCQHQFDRFLDRPLRQGHMDSHLVTVEVSIEGRTHQRMELNRLAFNQ